MALKEVADEVREYLFVNGTHRFSPGIEPSFNHAFGLIY